MPFQLGQWPGRCVWGWVLVFFSLVIKLANDDNGHDDEIDKDGDNNNDDDDIDDE